MMWAIGEKNGVSVLRSKSRQVCFILLMGIFVRFSLLLAYDWPIREDTVQHVINSTLGEWRNGHFHAGIDINAPCSTGVYAIEGDICYKDIDTLPPITIRGINIGHFRYFHVVIRDIIDDTSYVGPDSLFAKTDTADHVHLQEADRRLTAPGPSANDAIWLN